MRLIGFASRLLVIWSRRLHLSRTARRKRVLRKGCKHDPEQ